MKALLQQILASQQQGQQDVQTVKTEIRTVKTDIEITKGNIKTAKADIKDLDTKYDIRTHGGLGGEVRQAAAETWPRARTRTRTWTWTAPLGPHYDGYVQHPALTLIFLFELAPPNFLF